MRGSENLQGQVAFMHYCCPHIEVGHFSAAITSTSVYLKSGMLWWSGAMAEARGQNSAESQGYKQACDSNDSDDPSTRLAQHTAHRVARFSV